MSDRRYDEDMPVISGPAPEPEVENPLVPVSLAATLTKAEIDQQIATAHAWPRSPARARDMMISLATLDEKMAEECIYSVPRGGKQIRGPSIRFAEIVLSAWGNVRCAARVTHEDKIERYVEAEALVHDLETNVGYVARARRRIELKRGRKTVDPDMIQIAGAAAISVARRNAILGCIPKTVWRRALEAVESVVKGDMKTLVERRDAAVAYFNKAGVSTEKVLKALEVKHLDDITLDHLVDLGGMRAAIRTGEATFDMLFPEERDLGPRPETLEEKLRAIGQVDPVTGEITPQTPAQQWAGAIPDAPPAPPAPTAPPRSTRAPRKPSPLERLQVEGDIAAAKGMPAYTEWYSALTSDDMAVIPIGMDQTWKETAVKVTTSVR